MFLSQALDRLYAFSPEQFSSLAEVLSPKLIARCLKETGTATLRRRRLPMEMIIWSLAGMALFRHIPMGQIVNQLDTLTIKGKTVQVLTSMLAGCQAFFH